MRTRSITVLALILAAGALAYGEMNIGGGASFETGRPPIFPVLPQLFIQNVYRVGPWQAFGLDLTIAASPENSSFANGAAAGPLVCVGADASYLFPMLGPVEPAVLVGGWAFRDYHNLVNGSTAQAGVGAAVRIGDFFIQGRVLYRFFASTGISKAPEPMGILSIALLGGVTL